MLQILVVALLVTWCAFYALWTLMLSAAKKKIAVALLRYRLPAALADALRRHASAASGCGCDGCDRAPKPAKLASGDTPISFHPRRLR
ncbi:MAG: hypothetical protein ABI330_09280 [Caldimonas sp.]